ncbi:MAG: flavin-containing monooxygenase [Flavobacteriaceae bacterium]
MQPMMKDTTQQGRRESVDAVVVGAGFAGLYAIHRLRKLGLSVRCFETGDGVGGTWYWNCYPGARCDVESMQYSFSFDDALQQEWVWSERYPAQAEIQRYLDHVADRFDLRKDIRFATTVASATYDESDATWLVVTDSGDEIRCRFCIMATGCLSAARVPDISGLSDFRGEWYHTGRWPKTPVSFKGKRVGVIGTGSSGIQAIPVIAAEAAHLYVFQRTPNFSIPAWNAPLPKEAQDAWKKDYPAHREKARNTRSGILYEYATRGTWEVDDAERQTEYERRWQRGGANFTHCFNDLFVDKKANDLAAEFVRQKIRSIVPDAEVARRLAPTDHAIGTKRICVDTDYYATYNRPNVTLVDLRETPIKRIVGSGIRTSAGDYELDTIVFATGYDAVTGALARIDIRGRAGQKLSDKWVGGPRSYLGIMMAGFPNLFVITGPGSPSILTNVVVSIEQHVEWVTQCLSDMLKRGARVIEPTEDAENAWVEEVNKVAAGTLFPQTKSWYMGANIPGKPRVFLPYVGGFGKYREICRDVASDGYRGFMIA